MKIGANKPLNLENSAFYLNKDISTPNFDVQKQLGRHTYLCTVDATNNVFLDSDYHLHTSNPSRKFPQDQPLATNFTNFIIRSKRGKKKGIKKEGPKATIALCATKPHKAFIAMFLSSLHFMLVPLTKLFHKKKRKEQAHINAFLPTCNADLLSVTGRDLRADSSHLLPP